MTRIRNLITKACRPSHWLAGCYTGAASSGRDGQYDTMESGAGFFIFIFAIFLGWLMQSNKTAKEKVLFIGWAIMIFIVAAQAVQLLIK